MDIDWMTGAELAQAIPPAYTEWIGEHLLHVTGPTPQHRPKASADLDPGPATTERSLIP